MRSWTVSLLHCKVRSTDTFRGCSHIARRQKTPYKRCYFESERRLSGYGIPNFSVPGHLAWVDELPPGSRAVIVLHYLEEMSLDEVAAVLEISPGTVKSRLAYGLARLRRHTAVTQTNT